MTRIFRNALQVGRIAGLGAFWRTLRRGGISALAARLDELVALLQLIRAWILGRV